MINISAEDAKLFQDNGFTKEQIGATINHYRQQGLSDDDIQLKINDRLSSFGKATAEEKKGIDLTPSGVYKKAVAGAVAPLRAAIYKESIPEAYQAGMEKLEEFKPAGGAGDFIFDTAVYSRLPMLKGASAAGKVGAFAGNVAIQGGLPGLLEGAKEGNALEGAGAGTGIAAGVQGALSGLPVVGRGISKVINAPKFQQGVANTLEALTSVPSDYSKTALQNELAGNSIFKGGFDVDAAYIPIERKIRQAKEMLPTSADFGNEYYKLGQKAIQGMDNLEQQAGAKINEVLEGLNIDPIDANGIRNSVNSALNSFSKGGDINPAAIRANKEIDLIKNLLGETDQKLKPIDLHSIKEILYDMANYETAGGIKNKVLKRSANQVNNFLRSKFPQYQEPNDIYSIIVNATEGLKGEGTIGSKISEIGSTQSALSGLDQRLKNVDNLLPVESKFYKQAQDVIKSEDEINAIKNAIGKQYERNPRLLANRTDEAFETAINDLQRKTGVNFMDELQKIRAREAFEKWFPGQGGGSGSSQGFGNLLRTALIGGAPTAAAITHNPAALLGLGAVSPKFTGKGAIQNLGRLNQMAQGWQNLVPENVQRLLTPALVQLGVGE